MYVKLVLLRQFFGDSRDFKGENTAEFRENLPYWTCAKISKSKNH